MNRADILEQFAGLGERCTLFLKDGTYYEGYILEVNETEFEFGMGGPLAQEEPYILKNDDVDLSRLSYFCISSRKYLDISWNKEIEKFVTTECKE